MYLHGTKVTTIFKESIMWKNESHSFLSWEFWKPCCSITVRCRELKFC